MHAAAYLRSKSPPDIRPVAVLFGEERYWKRASLEQLERTVLGEGEDRLGLTRFAGDGTELKTVCDELLTISMWGDRRLVVVDEADRFVSQYREGIEKYLKKPAKKSVLVLDVKTWPKTTRLAKLVAKMGLELECSTLTGPDLVAWLVDQARRHGKTLGRESAALVIELAGADLGLLEQEIAKLVAFVGPRVSIDPDDVETLVGGWTTQTTWAIAGALRRGRTGEALDLLDKLLEAGESPHKILGGLSFVFRRLAQSVERTRQGEPLDAALRSAGVFPRELGESASYLRRMGRAQALGLYQRLLAADTGLKGSLNIPERHVIELLTTRLGASSALSRAD